MTVILILVVMIFVIALAKVITPTTHEVSYKTSIEFWKLAKMSTEAEMDEFRSGMVGGAQKFDQDAHLGLKSKQVMRLRRAVRGSSS